MLQMCSLCCKMASPSRRILPAGAVLLRQKSRQEDPVSRILSCAVIPLDAASPRTFISDLPGGFGVLRTAAPCEARHPWIFQSSLTAPGRHRTRSLLRRASPSLFGLAPCGVYPAPGVTAGAVRSYRTFSPLPRHGLAVQANLSGLSGSSSTVAKTREG